jgi:hypothetical protein
MQYSDVKLNAALANLQHFAACNLNNVAVPLYWLPVTLAVPEPCFTFIFDKPHDKNFASEVGTKDESVFILW